MCAAAVFALSASDAPNAFAQVVQLPAVQTFGYSGAATVPDSGGAYLGGVARQRTGSTTAGAGPVAGRASSSATGATSVTGWASIIDLQAMDAAILNEPASKRPQNYDTRATGTPIMNTLTPQLYARRTGADQLPARRQTNDWQMALSGGGGPQMGPANAMLHDDSAVRYFMLKAKEAHNTGHEAAALIFYRMAYERLTPAQRERLHEIQAQADAAAKAGQQTAPAAAANTAASPTPPTTPATSAASSEAGAAPPATTEESGNPFGSPF